LSFKEQVTDTDLAALKDCKNLTRLDLDRTQLSDKGLDRIRQFPQLKFLSVLKTNVTAKGIDALKKDLPGCRILWDGGTIEPKK
jgi:hypothetical protein